MSTTEKCNDSLQKEVEEERNASGVATNEAMSMITRLQEEKATLQMEALKYYRMMEKQPEYDTDELEKVNGLLIEKEKEIQDLEVELEFYRSNMADDEPMVHNMRVYPMKALKIVLPARITPLRCHGKLEFALLLKLLLLL